MQSRRNAARVNERSNSSAPDRITVLHILWHGKIGGAERAVFQLVKEQMHDSCIKPAILFAQKGGFYWERARLLGCPVITLDLPHTRAARYLPKIMSELRNFDLHHFHSAEPLLMIASLACRNTQRVYTHRGGLIDYAPKKRVRHALVGTLLRFFFHKFSGNTAHAAKCAAALFRIPYAGIQVTYNGVDFDSLAPQLSRDEVRAGLGLNSGEYVIGVTAVLKPWKRIELLLEAIASLQDYTVRLLIVGDGIDRSRLERRVRELGVESQVVFAGRQENVADYLQIMDVFCLPSMGLESFGNAAIEAMAKEVPTIVFADGGGLVEHIEHAKTGFIVQDQLELIDTLKRLQANKELARAIGQRGGSLVRERYSLSSSALAYRSLYSNSDTQTRSPKASIDQFTEERS